jgi:hypothetical protein
MNEHDEQVRIFPREALAAFAGARETPSHTSALRARGGACVLITRTLAEILASCQEVWQCIDFIVSMHSERD